MIDERTDQYRHDRKACAEQMCRQTGDVALNDDDAEIPDIHIDRIDIEDLLYPFRVAVNIVEHGRKIVEQLCENVIQVFDILEDHKQ